MTNADFDLLDDEDEAFAAGALPQQSRQSVAVDYLDALEELNDAEPVARFWVGTPFDIVRDGLALALVRPRDSRPQEVEVIDCLIIDGPAFQRAVIKLARLRRQLVRLAGKR